MPKSPDPHSSWVEPDIVINGQTLSFAECMAVRVAVTSFRMFCNESVSRQELGGVAGGYDRMLANVEDKMRRGL